MLWILCFGVAHRRHSRAYTRWDQAWYELARGACCVRYVRGDLQMKMGERKAGWKAGMMCELMKQTEEMRVVGVEVELTGQWLENVEVVNDQMHCGRLALL